MKSNITRPSAQIPYIAFFKKGLYWNLFDSVSSQGLVILFHILLRSFYGTHLHGKMGCLLSVFYIGIVLCNGGLDQSLAPFLEEFTKNRPAFRSFFYTVLLPQIAIVSISAALFFLGYFFFFSSHESFFTRFPDISPPFFTLLCASFLLESLRKTCRTFLQLIFYNQLTALVETGNMIVFILLIVGFYVLQIPLSLLSLWIIFSALVALQLVILIGGILRFYSSLPADVTKQPAPKNALRMIKTRVFTWANQSVSQFFSGNILVPLCALRFGIEQASLMKVISTISQWVTLISHKTFGISSNALFAHLKSRSLETQQNAFSYLSSLLNQALYFLFIFLLINGKKITLLQIDPAATISWSLLYFMILNSFLESLFVLYEKWYIFEEEAFYIFFFNVTSFSLLYLFIISLHSPLSIALSILGLRTLTLLSITFFSSYRWHIWPSFAPRAITLTIAVLVSSFLYIII
ncbi:hypothetical protein H0X06_02810 [Candidatus Dependentiae bacterium]|nr:hypothetical protein [Candidatus Dependentiae bacterium]